MRALHSDREVGQQSCSVSPVLLLKVSEHWVSDARACCSDFKAQIGTVCRVANSLSTGANKPDLTHEAAAHGRASQFQVPFFPVKQGGQYVHGSGPSDTERAKGCESEWKLAWVVDIVEIPVLEAALAEDEVLFAHDNDDNSQPIRQNEEEGIKGFLEAMGTDACKDNVDSGSQYDQERTRNALEPRTEHLHCEREAVQIWDVVGNDGKLRHGDCQLTGH